MKKTFLFVLALTPVWLCAQHKVIELIPTSGSMTSYTLSNISKQTFSAGNLVTNFNDGSTAIESMLTGLSKVTFGTSTVTALASESIATDYNLYPMPVQDEMHLSFDSQTAATATLQVLTLDGRTVLSSTQAVVSGNNSLNFNVSTLAQGIYICRLSYGAEHYTQQIIKE